MAVSGATGRTNQKARTRKAIVEACRELIRSGAEVTMPQVAQLALVSEATAYRYFPDLVSLIQEALGGLWPEPAQALAPIIGSTDPGERVAFACEHLLRHVLAYQGAVRATISHTITAPLRARDRPGLRFGLIDHALAPFQDPAGPAYLSPAALDRLKLDLAITVSAEALFVLTDLCRLPPEEAIASAVCTATTLTRAAFTDPPA
ncbi:transcriptional regulator, TetR family [Frankia torreyi]|uniref:Transcriptional regulator, TetR family n=1 Tax=Frankia torreyi TaxID=1856 RepID=A0A0D8BEG2_9ACTN|nr:MULTISPECIES: TetR/AcrR family transcriptional regulator [Frankia]KJE22349.1 transcriptional regulator, TetR family [Frankia torreyi]KQC35190.1 TetR family transcriptional regulator [Frankia sp. ACN1ag]KQM05144.1 transcriptional regulator, TetR family [Frankia sp. CpI1-P]